MADRPDKFRVIDGGDKPRPYHRRRDGDQMICRICEADTGVATSEFVETTIAPREAGPDIAPGTKSLICVACLARGKITRII